MGSRLMPWVMIIASPILAAIQLSRGSWVIDLVFWLMLIGVTAQFLSMLNAKWSLAALLLVAGFSLAWLGRIGLVFNYFIITNGLYQLIGAESWGPMPASVALAIIMVAGFDTYSVGLILMGYESGNLTIREALRGVMNYLVDFMLKYSYLIAFLIPFIIRLIPEIVSWPWFVGYDTPEYAATLMDMLIRPEFIHTWWYDGWTMLPPLLFLVLYPIAHVASPWLIFKFNDAVLLGLIGVSMNLMLRRMGFSRGDALLASLLAALYPTMYTLSWEFAMLMLGLIMLMLTLTVMHVHIESGKRHWLVLMALTVLSALAHQVSATLTALVFITYFIIKDRDPRWLGLALIGIAADAVYTNFTILNVTRTTSGALTVSSSLIAGSTTSPYQALEGYLIQLIINYWPLIILVSHGLRRGNFIIYSLLAWILIILLPSALIPSESFVSWWIWSLMLPIPLAPLLTRPRALSLIILALVILLDVSWSWSTLVNYIFSTIGPEATLVQGIYPRACVMTPMENYAYDAGLYIVNHLNGTYVTGYCLYTFIHLADRFGANVIASYDPLGTALRLNGTVYLVTTQYLSNYTLIARFGNVEILPYNTGVAYPVYVFLIKNDTSSLNG
ncbi:hypothetical protein [Caldivirga maquilingensis]|uniref:hypothetical protein n=1 Tax=Caldivirga maquilingensis TaxID=76887 RepID=UPI0012EA1AFD|nr:hypothetical protein [Caldivirga maquilingensis]